MKVGVVGCGTIAAYHLPTITQHERVDSVSIVDVDRPKADAIAAQFKVDHVYQDLEHMLQEQRPDVVHILTPPALHAKLAIQAMDYGCHVLVEKPMALTLEDANAMAAAAQRNQVQLCVDHNFLFDPNVLHAWKLVQTGQAGKILHVDACYSFDVNRIPGFDPNSQTSWHLKLPGGLLLDSVAHPLSILLRFLPPPVNFNAISKNSGALSNGRPDELRVLIDCGEATGTLSVSLGTRPDCFTVNIYATDMTLHLNISNMVSVVRKNRALPKKILRIFDNLDQARQLFFGTFINAFKVATGNVGAPGDIAPLINQFYRSLEHGTQPPVTSDEGKAVVKFIHEIWQQTTQELIC